MKRKKLNYLTAAVILILVLCAAAEWIMPNEEIRGDIEREEYGKGEKTVSVIAEIGYGGNTSEKKLELRISPEELTKEEKLERLRSCKEALPELILGENRDPEHITEDMELITYHDETGVSILWDTEDPDLINQNGDVYPRKEDDNGYVLLTALLSIEGEEAEFKCNVRHTLKLDDGNYEKLAERELSKINDRIEEMGNDPEVELPQTLGPDISVVWKKPKDHKAALIAVVVLMAVLMVRHAEASRDKKRAEQRREEILTEFPDFMDKLVMLLSAGVILREAVERITADYKENVRPTGEKIFYEELCLSVERMNKSNSSFSEELTLLAKRLEIREFARLAVVLKDSLGSGMDLADKLENESLMLRTDRKAQIRKLGKTADSKLIFPLMVILLALIVIVMTPAVMQM